MKNLEQTDTSNYELQVDARQAFDEDLRSILAHRDLEEDSAVAINALERLLTSDITRRVLAINARKFWPVKRLEQRDFEQSGIEGVYDALSRADPDLPPQAFHSYFSYRVFDRMFILAAKHGQAVSLSEGTLKKVVKSRRIDSGLDEGKPLETLLEEQKLSGTDYDKAKGTAALASALSYEVVVREDTNFLALSSDHDSQLAYASDPAKIFEENDDIAAVLSIIEDFGERDKYIISSYYGLDMPKSMTLREIANELGVTESRICQIVARLKTKIRDKLITQGRIGS
jgi:RNA polymerase sigma factor FliA